MTYDGHHSWSLDEDPAFAGTTVRRRDRGRTPTGPDAAAPEYVTTALAQQADLDARARVVVVEEARRRGFAATQVEAYELMVGPDDDDALSGYLWFDVDDFEVELGVSSADLAHAAPRDARLTLVRSTCWNRSGTHLTCTTDAVRSVTALLGGLVLLVLAVGLTVDPAPFSARPHRAAAASWPSARAGTGRTRAGQPGDTGRNTEAHDRSRPGPPDLQQHRWLDAR